MVDEVDGKLDVLMDGGVRRGTDVFKALALGARAVLVGRPYLWGLAVAGEEGVRRVIELLPGARARDGSERPSGGGVDRPDPGEYDVGARG